MGLYQFIFHLSLNLPIFALTHSSIHLSIYIFKKYLLRICQMPDTGDLVEIKTENFLTLESHTPAWQSLSKLLQVLLVLQRRQLSQEHKILLALNSNFYLVKGWKAHEAESMSCVKLSGRKNSQGTKTQCLWIAENEEGKSNKWSWHCRWVTKLSPFLS